MQPGPSERKPSWVNASYEIAGSESPWSALGSRSSGGAESDGSAHSFPSGTAARRTRCSRLQSRLVAIPNKSYGLVTALRVHLPHYSVNMILHCELGQIQICRDLFVAEPHRYQRH